VNPQNRIKMPALKEIAWIPSKVSLLLYRKKETLSQREKELLKYLQKKSPEIKSASLLSHKFREMMENKQGHLLKKWVKEVEHSSIKELKGFAKGLLSDYQAVKNALSLPWSNGQVEGQINKLKMIKRQMYGRASFNLLRKRIILSGGLST
jgi:transposase